MTTPPNDLPRYRLLTGPDDNAFCHRVSEALAMGFKLHGSPAATFDGNRVIVAQAVLWADDTTNSAGMTPEKAHIPLIEPHGTPNTGDVTAAAAKEAM